MRVRTYGWWAQRLPLTRPLVSFQFLGTPAFCRPWLWVSNLGGVASVCDTQLGVCTPPLDTCKVDSVHYWTRESACVPTTPVTRDQVGVLEACLFRHKDHPGSHINSLRSSTLSCCRRHSECTSGSLSPLHAHDERRNVECSSRYVALSPLPTGLLHFSAMQHSFPRRSQCMRSRWHSPTHWKFRIS
jgi:hypothetical protein